MNKKSTYLVYARRRGNWFFDTPRRCADLETAKDLMEELARVINVAEVHVRVASFTGALRTVARRVNHGGEL